MEQQDETKTDSDQEIKSLYDIVSQEELETFYKLLPKVQEAHFFLESINNNQEEKETDTNTNSLTPYMVELDINCIVSKKGNSITVAQEPVHHEEKKFYIDFIVSDYKEFINTFFLNIEQSLTKTCKDVFDTKNDQSKQK